MKGPVGSLSFSRVTDGMERGYDRNDARDAMGTIVSWSLLAHVVAPVNGMSGSVGGLPVP